MSGRENNPLRDRAADTVSSRVAHPPRTRRSRSSSSSCLRDLPRVPGLSVWAFTCPLYVFVLKTLRPSVTTFSTTTSPTPATSAPPRLSLRNHPSMVLFRGVTCDLCGPKIFREKRTSISEYLE